MRRDENVKCVTKYPHVFTPQSLAQLVFNLPQLGPLAAPVAPPFHPDSVLPNLYILFTGEVSNSSNECGWDGHTYVISFPKAVQMAP